MYLLWYCFFLFLTFFVVVIVGIIRPRVSIFSIFSIAIRSMKQHCVGRWKTNVVFIFHIEAKVLQTLSRIFQYIVFQLN